MGSIDDNGSGSYYAYRTSKAAVNIVNKRWVPAVHRLVCVLSRSRACPRAAPTRSQHRSCLPPFPCSLSIDLAPHNVTCTLLHPGYVRTGAPAAAAPAACLCTVLPRLLGAAHRSAAQRLSTCLPQT